MCIRDRDYTVTYAIKKDASGKAENKLGNTVVSTIKYSKDAQNNYGCLLYTSRCV